MFYCICVQDKYKNSYKTNVKRKRRDICIPGERDRLRRGDRERDRDGLLERRGDRDRDRRGDGERRGD